MRVLALEITAEGVDEHARDNVRVKRHAVRLTDAVHVAVGGELDEHEITPADTGRRVAGDEGFDVGEFHRAGRL